MPISCVSDVMSRAGMCNDSIQCVTPAFFYIRFSGKEQTYMTMHYELEELGFKVEKCSFCMNIGRTTKQSRKVQLLYEYWQNDQTKQKSAAFV